MERMEGVDAGYLYMETPAMHMHTLKIALVQPSGTFDLGRFTGLVIDRLGALPPFRRRVLPVPFHLGHPLWIADREIDPARHVFVHQVPEPGGLEGLEKLIGRIASTPLDRSVPLWEIHVCEPFDDDRVAFVAKMHHAIADGNAANALLAHLTDLPGLLAEVGAGPVTAPHPPLDPTPSRRTQVWLALRDGTRQLFTLPALVRRTLTAVAAVGRRRREATVDVPRPILDAPRTSLNGTLTARRDFATCSVPLEDVKRVKDAHGVTLNDVVLGVVSGALRDWLATRGEHPSVSLLAGVPVGTDPPEGPARLGGNRVSNLFTSLATDIDDPVERLHAISRTTEESKIVQRTLGPNLLVDWVQFTPHAPMSAVMRAYSWSAAAAHHSPPFNVVVSNVRGPGESITISGARLLDLYSVGPILEGIGLNVTAWSYAGRLNFSLLTCPDLVADLGAITAGIRTSLEELLAVEG